MDELYYINVGPAGTFQKSGAFHSTPKSVDDIVAYIEQNDIDHVGIYLHGGLVGEAAGMAGRCGSARCLREREVMA